MTRPIRIEFPGALYHVTSRGNALGAIFLEECDRATYLSVLAEVVRRFNWLCHAYCLMENHYHLLVETPEPNLSAGMHHLNGVYTQIVNRRHNRVGHIFQGRFKSIVVEKEHHLLELCRYIVLNPVRAGIVDAPESWIWSSYRATSGVEASPSFLTTTWILSCFGKELSPAQREYKKFVRDGMCKSGSPLEGVCGQVYLGDEDFLGEMHQYIRDKQKLSEIPRQQRLVARPAVKELFAAVETQNKFHRNKMIEEAHEKHGYSLTEIADALGLHYTTISKILKS